MAKQSKTNSVLARTEYAVRVERLITVLEILKPELRTDIELPESLSDLTSKIEEGLSELYHVKREIRDELQDVDDEAREDEFEEPGLLGAWDLNRDQGKVCPIHAAPKETS